MPNIGAPELIIILVIALLVLGPGKLPEVGKSIGQSIREFRKASTDVQEGMNIDPTPAAHGRSGGTCRRRSPAAPVAAAPVAAAVAAPVVARRAGRGRARRQRADGPEQLTLRVLVSRWPTPTPCVTPASRPSR